MQSAMVRDFDAFQNGPQGNTAKQRRPTRFQKRISLPPSQGPGLCLRWRLRRHGFWRLYGLNIGVGKLRRTRASPNVPGQFAAVAIDLVESIADLQCRVVLAEMAQHEQGRA